jgi:hypothetical protein
MCVGIYQVGAWEKHGGVGDWLWLWELDQPMSPLEGRVSPVRASGSAEAGLSMPVRDLSKQLGRGRREKADRSGSDTADVGPLKPVWRLRTTFGNTSKFLDWVPSFTVVPVLVLPTYPKLYLSNFPRRVDIGNK